MKTYTKRFTVQKSDIDHNGHVSNLRYLEWFLDAAAAHAEHLGFGFDTLKQMGRTWVAREHHIIYKNSAFEGDELELTSWLDPIKSVQGVRKYALRKTADGSPVCEGYTTWVFVETEHYRPKKIPQYMIDNYYNGDSLDAADDRQLPCTAEAQE